MDGRYSIVRYWSLAPSTSHAKRYLALRIPARYSPAPYVRWDWVPPYRRPRVSPEGVQRTVIDTGMSSRTVTSGDTHDARYPPYLRGREILAVVGMKHADRLVRRAPNTCPGVWPGAPLGRCAERSNVTALHHDEGDGEGYGRPRRVHRLGTCDRGISGPMAAGGPYAQVRRCQAASTITWE